MASLSKLGVGARLVLLLLLLLIRDESMVRDK
jgi:hypothetical protein